MLDEAAKRRELRAKITLLLCIPLPSIGVVFAMLLYPNTWYGQAIFMLCKVLILLTPLTVFCFLDKQKIAWSTPKRGGFISNILIGAVIVLIIYLAYVFLGDIFIDAAFFQEKLEHVGFTQPIQFILPALYWTFVNALQEEYFWRWFVVYESEKFASSKVAIGISALGFVLHHVIAMKVYFDWPTTLLCALGILIGGLLWSVSYVRYRSIWPGYVSHIMIDAVIFTIGYQILF